MTVEIFIFNISIILNVNQCGAAKFFFAAPSVIGYFSSFFSSSARSVFSQGRFRSGRPKWPYAATCR